MELKKMLKELLILSEKITRSDLQGIAYAKAIEMNKNKVNEIENILLLYVDREININETKRFLLDLM